jgi:HK97 gp10 family phage protein
MAENDSRVLGLDKLNRKLHELPAEMQKTIRKASEDGAEEMVGMAKRLVPVDSGALQASIAWTYGEPPAGSIGGGGTKRKPGGKVRTGTATSGDRISVYAGDSRAYYARWVEFGTAAQSAQPFFFPSFRALKKRMKSRNARAMNKAAKKVAAGGN